MDREGQVALTARGVRFAPQPLDELFARMRAIALQYEEREELLRLGRTPRAITDAHAPHTHLERAEEEDLQRVGALRRAFDRRGPLRREDPGDGLRVSGCERELGQPSAKPRHETGARHEEVAVALLAHGPERVLELAIGTLAIRVETGGENARLRFGVSRSNS